MLQFLKSALLFMLFLSINQGYSQSWEIMSPDKITDISGIGDSLFIVGYQSNAENLESFIGLSTDGGETWKKTILNPYISVEGTPICVGFFDAQNGIIGIKGSLTKEYLKTSDGGLSWEAFVPDLPEECHIPQPWDIEIINQNTAVISQFQSGNYIITEDGGNTWNCNTLFSVSWLPNFETINDTTFFNFDTDGIYKSVDVGLNWIKLIDKEFAAYTMKNELSGFALTPYYINNDSYPELKKTDDGWETIESQVLTELQDLVVEYFAAINSDEIFFFNGANIYYSTDGGSTTSFLQSLEFEPIRIVMIQDDWYATGRGLAKYNPEGIITDISKNSLMENQFVFPNPVTHSELNLNSDKYRKYEILNLNGQVIQSGTIAGKTIKLGARPSGLYLLKLISANNDIRTYTIIIE